MARSSPSVISCYAIFSCRPRNFFIPDEGIDNGSSDLRRKRDARFLVTHHMDAINRKPARSTAP